MTLTNLPAAQANAAIAAMFPSPGTDFLGLQTGAPGTTGANEVTGGSYARQSATVGAAALGIELTTNAQNFTGMPACTVTAASMWSASSGGTYEGGVVLGSSLTVPAAATVAFAVGAVSLGVSG